MNPLTFIVLTFGVWIVARNQFGAFWALATTPNAAGSVLAPSQGTGAGGSQASPSAPTPAQPQGPMSPMQYMGPGYLSLGPQ